MEATNMAAEIKQRVEGSSRKLTRISHKILELFDKATDELGIHPDREFHYHYAHIKNNHTRTKSPSFWSSKNCISGTNESQLVLVFPYESHDPRYTSPKILVDFLNAVMSLSGTNKTKTTQSVFFSEGNPGIYGLGKTSSFIAISMSDFILSLKELIKVNGRSKDLDHLTASEIATELEKLPEKQVLETLKQMIVNVPEEFKQTPAKLSTKSSLTSWSAGFWNMLGTESRQRTLVTANADNSSAETASISMKKSS